MYNVDRNWLFRRNRSGKESEKRLAFETVLRQDAVAKTDSFSTL